MGIVLDLREAEVVDIFGSMEFKGSTGIRGALELEAGGQVKVSLMGKGTELTTQTKLKYKWAALEYEAKIIESPTSPNLF